MNFLISIAALLVSTILFCWLFTMRLGFGPICHLAFFIVGIFSICLAGIISLKSFADDG